MIKSDTTMRKDSKEFKTGLGARVASALIRCPTFMVSFMNMLNRDSKIEVKSVTGTAVQLAPVGDDG